MTETGPAAAVRPLLLTLWQRQPGYRHITLLTHQLAMLLEAGLSLTRALETLSGPQTPWPQQQLLHGMIRHIASGQSFASTLSHYGSHFDRLYISLVSAGEHSGTLAETLTRVAVIRDQHSTLTSQLHKALIYPACVLVTTLALLIVMLTTVVPAFEGLFASVNQPLPGLTRMVISLAHHVPAMGIASSGIVTLGMGLYHYLPQRSPAWRRHRDQWRLKGPVIGHVRNLAILSRSCRVLSQTLGAGLPLTQSLQLAGDACDNVIWEARYKRVYQRISRGSSLKLALGNDFPLLLIQLASAGEAAGTLTEIFDQAARFYADKLASASAHLNRLLEPVLLLGISGVVGVIVMAMYLPLFQLGAAL